MFYLILASETDSSCMGKKVLFKSFTLAGKISLLWLLLFTMAAIFAHWAILQGREIEATPELAYLPPFTNPAHLLGTDQLGRDVLFYLFLSCRTAWLLSFPPLVLTTILGVAGGTGAAILGNSGMTINRVNFYVSLFLLLVFLYLSPVLDGLVPIRYIPLASTAYWLTCMGLLLYFLIFRGSPSKVSKHITIPVDEVLEKSINIWSTLPKLLLLLLLSAFGTFSLYSLVGWICLGYWVLPARVARTTVLQIKQEPYYETAKALGIPFQTKFLNFIWPALQGPILTNFCFAASGLLGIGSTLAYMGIGVPADIPSWGKMLANARFSVEAWWLIAFPAALLLVSILSLQTIGQQFQKSTRQKTL
ncbi:ABC transporter permease subunit [Rufibacter immobilis]|uniref:ABC transporter permease subunit n=1 Tax=Rufibacter immobilis TaxID=1348778 RepID=UPI00366CC911